MTSLQPLSTRKEPRVPQLGKRFSWGWEVGGRGVTDSVRRGVAMMVSIFRSDMPRPFCGRPSPGVRPVCGKSDQYQAKHLAVEAHR